MATVAELSYEMFGVRPEPAVARFDEDGWAYDETSDSRCPGCHGELHAMGKPYTSGGREYRYAAFVCAACVQTFTLQDLGYQTRKALAKPPKPQASVAKHGATPAGLEEMSSISTRAGLTCLREWKTFDADAAIGAMEGALIRWGGALPIPHETVRGSLPDGGAYAARQISGELAPLPHSLSSISALVGGASQRDSHSPPQRRGADSPSRHRRVQ